MQPREYSDGNMMTVVKSENIFHLRNISGSILRIDTYPSYSLYIKFENKEHKNTLELSSIYLSDNE